MAATRDFKRVLTSLAIFFVPAAFVPLIATMKGFARVPPLLAGAGIIFGPVASAAIYLVYGYVRAHRPPKPRMLRFALLSLSFSLLLSMSHSALLQEWTVVDPQSGSKRFSIGFGMARWSLTEHGRSLAAQENIATPYHLMMADGDFCEGCPERLWKTWAIILSSVTLAAMFLLALAMWSAGWGALAVHLADTPNRPDPSRH